jgi:hypothetical protein
VSEAESFGEEIFLFIWPLMGKNSIRVVFLESVVVFMMFFLVILYFSVILCIEYFFPVSVSQYMYNSMVTIQFLHVSANIFGHLQVVLTQSLSTVSAIPPPLTSVYNLGKVILLFTTWVFTSSYVLQTYVRYTVF